MLLIIKCDLYIVSKSNIKSTTYENTFTRFLSGN